jgi:signal transduction histidine kinase
VSHELKGPIGAMVSEARLFLNDYLGPLNAEQKDWADRMVRKGEYLLSLIRDYLDLARLEGGDLQFEPKATVDFLTEVIEPAIELIQPQINEHQVILKREFDAALWPVECDADLMRVVFVNLLGNAVKYGKRGGLIRVRVTRKDARLLASVWNEGPGFPESERPKLFRRFSRLNTPALSRSKGTGVGLYTVWRIVHLHDGRVWARSEEGHWAEFSFAIPQPLEPSEARNATGS